MKKTLKFVCETMTISSRTGVRPKVKEGTNEQKVVFQHDARVIPISKDDKAEQVVYGIVYEPDVADAHGDMANAEEIRAACYNYMAQYAGVMKMNHTGNPIDCILLESYIAPVDFEMEGNKVTKGTWVMVARINDKEIWKKIVAGDLTGYSFAGYANVENLENDDE